MNEAGTDTVGATGEAIQVAVVARRPSLRAGLRELLLRSGVEVALELDPVPRRDADAAGQPESLRALDGIDALVVELVDVGGLESSDTPAWLRAALDELPALLLIDDPEQPLPPALARNDKSAPPRGWLPADASDAELAAAVGAVAAGLDVVDPSLARAAGASRPAPVGSADSDESEERGERVGDLTAREAEVLELVALGLPNKAIAQRLGISEHTAKFHVGSLLSKLGAGSRTEAVTAAVRAGLLAL